MRWGWLRTCAGATSTALIDCKDFYFFLQLAGWGEDGGVHVRAPPQQHWLIAKIFIFSFNLQDEVRMAAYMCGRHLNSTACNLLANLCALTLHSKVRLIFISEWKRAKHREKITNIHLFRRLPYLPHRTPRWDLTSMCAISATMFKIIRSDWGRILPRRKYGFFCIFFSNSSNSSNMTLNFLDLLAKVCVFVSFLMISSSRNFVSKG